MDASSNLVVDLMPFSAIPSLFNLSSLSQLLQDNFPALATDTLSALGQDVSSDHPSSISCPLFFFLPPSNFTTFEHSEYFSSASCLLSSPFLPFGNFSTLFALDWDIPLDHPSSFGLFLLLPSLDNFTYDG